MSEALVAGELELLQHIATGSPLARTLDGVCRLIEAQAGGAMCSILLVEEGGARFRHGAAPTLPPDYMAAFDQAPILAEIGPCAAAVVTRASVLVEDFALDARWGPIRPLVEAHGLRACWSWPILSAAGQPLGTLALYHRTPGAPPPRLVGVVARVVHLASLALERARGASALEAAEDALQRMRAELAHVARAGALGALTASIAHEVSQPLAAATLDASSCLRWLEADPPDLDEARAAARRALRDGQRAIEVVSRLRALYTKVPGESAPLDLDEAIRDVLLLVRRELKQAGATLELELACPPGAVVGDRVQLQQVVLNLALNAAEALTRAPGPRTLVVASRRREAGEVEVTVRDSGPGIDPQAGPCLFDSFFTTKRGGMGMGLSISRTIVEHHGGRIDWAPNGDGPGVTFRVRLPSVGA